MLNTDTFFKNKSIRGICKPPPPLIRNICGVQRVFWLKLLLSPLDIKNNPYVQIPEFAALYILL